MNDILITTSTAQSYAIDAVQYTWDLTIGTLFTAGAAYLFLVLMIVTTVIVIAIRMINRIFHN